MPRYDVTICLSPPVQTAGAGTVRHEVCLAVGTEPNDTRLRAALTQLQTRWPVLVMNRWPFPPCT